MRAVNFNFQVKFAVTRHWQTLTTYGNLRQSLRRRQSSCTGVSLKTDHTAVVDSKDEEEEDEL